MKDLLRRLEIEAPEDLEYFEHFCALMECEEEIGEDLFYDLLTRMQLQTMWELSEAYLEEITIGVPDDSIDLYRLLSSYRISLSRFFQIMEQEENHAGAMEELYRFRRWYAEKKQVSCRDLDENKTSKLSLSQALVLGRMERLGQGKYEFDFEPCFSFSYEEFPDPEDEEEPSDFYEREEDDPNVTLIDRDYPVIDGEYEDDYEEEEAEWLQ